MQTTLAALAVVAVGYILAYIVFDRLRDRFGYVGGAEYVLIGVLLGPHASGLLGPWPETVVQAVTLAAIATLSSPAAVDAFVDRARTRSPVLRVLQLTARIDALVAVGAFGLVLAVYHQGDVSPGIRPPTATEWAVINL